MAIAWLPSADRHGIPRDEALYAMTHATVSETWPPARDGRATPPTLFIGPSRYGEIEVIAQVEKPHVVIFHVMRVRQSTRDRIARQREEGTP